ncbi:unnamed protein product [Heligmosomoides polygyrus]|uniref:HTH_48 domain-containing protein n=1 Tax=Heligmosomoides polygyrus TaxID=6339 RepID=A0A183FQK3_HELPZ|nr:unnamed protein product [Heligmosomoides polygyrus]
MDQGRIRTFLYYEWLLGNDTGTAVANICRACKEDAVSQRTVRRWFNRFENGDTSLEDREHSWRPSTVDDDEVRRCIKEKPEATTRELATMLGCSKSTIHNQLNLLRYHKVLARWIPHRLTDANKQSRVTVCQSLLLQLSVGCENMNPIHGTLKDTWLLNSKMDSASQHDRKNRRFIVVCHVARLNAIDI